MENDLAEMIGVDSFRKIDGIWSCAQAAARTDVETGICLIFFAGHRRNHLFLDLIDTVRKKMAKPPALLVLQAADPSCHTIMMQMSLSATNLPQLFLTDISGILTPASYYNGHRAHDALLNYLEEKQKLAKATFSNSMSTTSIPKQSQIVRAGAASSV